jgi:hypothetical protein
MDEKNKVIDDTCIEVARQALELPRSDYVLAVLGKLWCEGKIAGIEACITKAEKVEVTV